MNAEPPLDSEQKYDRLAVATGLIVVVVSLLLGGCKGIPTPGERRAQQEVKTVGETYRPQNQRPSLPTLQTNAGLSNVLAFAMLNQPQV